MMADEKEVMAVHPDNTTLKLRSLLSVKEQISRLRFVVFACLLVSTVVLAGILVVARITGADLRILTIDPADVELRPAYIGMLSQFGVILWAASATLCFFGASFLRKTPNAELFRFLLASGIVCSALLFDDALLLHDRVFPHTFGIPEKLVYAVYLGAFLLYIVRFLRAIAATEYLLFLTAGSFLGISVLMDYFLPVTSLETFIEDGLKFTGILFWLAYFAYTTTSLVSKHSDRIPGDDGSSLRGRSIVEKHRSAQN